MISPKPLIFLLLAVTTTFKVEAFSPSAVVTRGSAVSSSESFRLYNSLTNDDEDNDDVPALSDRRNIFSKTATASVFALTTASTFFGTDGGIMTANAEGPKKVVVAGATGQTGRLVLEKLVSSKLGLDVIAGVRNVDKATKTLSESSTVVRGAMVQKVGSVDTSGITLKHIDVVNDSISDMAKTLDGADSLVIAIGFVPGNPFKMNDEAHKVDNVGTIALIDAAKASGTIKKVVLVSSILTNGRAWGQEDSPGFVITNAFGKVLDEKIIAENYLRKSGLDYTIVRPGGLKSKPPTGGLIISKEDTLNSGEISRELVADVCVASLSDSKASNKVLEIIEAEDGGPKVFNGLNM